MSTLESVELGHLILSIIRDELKRIIRVRIVVEQNIDGTLKVWDGNPRKVNYWDIPRIAPLNALPGEKVITVLLDGRETAIINRTRGGVGEGGGATDPSALTASNLGPSIAALTALTNPNIATADKVVLADASDTNAAKSATLTQLINYFFTFYDPLFADAVHNHDADYSDINHDHDTDYYTIATMDSVLQEFGDRLDQGPSEILLPVGFVAANQTALTVTALNNLTLLQYMGKSSRLLTSAQARYRVGTAAATITWAEFAVYKGAHPGPATGASVTRCGWADVSAVVNTTGLKTTSITLSDVNAEPGDDLWLAWGCNATTILQLRAGLGDDLQSGNLQLLSGRPSLNATASTASVNAATAMAWLALVL